MSQEYFLTEISRHIWDAKYRHREADRIIDRELTDTWRRIARGLASVEPEDQEHWEQRFYDILEGFRFLPGGRIQAGTGTARRVTLFNCFVMGVIEDSMDGIFDSLKEGALTMQQGGGVGYDFSTLRPRGTLARAAGAVASGPVSFMRIWDAMCGTLLSTGSRRGAMMATLRCDHPDIHEFIEAKQDRSALRNFNLSVQVTDAFMEAVRSDSDWPLVFPAENIHGHEGETVNRDWPGYGQPIPCKIVSRVGARELWDRLMRATYDYAEPGVLFIDRINHMNNLWYREHITATNPCGEIPLPPYGACNLGSINLTQFIRHPFSDEARVDLQVLGETVTTAVRLMDNVTSASRFPLPAQRDQAHHSRRIGLGVTGLADSLILLGLRYDSDAARNQAAEVMRTVCHSAYRASIELARERGSFPAFEKEQYLQGPFIQTLPEEIRDGIARHGIRNSHLTAIAPTGTISLLANNVSSGIEPVYDWSYQRAIREADGHLAHYKLTDFALQRWREERGDEPVPETFVRAWEIAPEAHLDMQAAVQPYVDSAISKTINVPPDYEYEAFQSLYEAAYGKGLKGCTTFRENPVTGSVLDRLPRPHPIAAPSNARPTRARHDRGRVTLGLVVGFAAVEPELARIQSWQQERHALANPSRT
jgi:ribonucleoside-diphosphate reductase alpha chain